MTTFDLTALTDFALSVMEDSCSIRRDTNGPADDTLDQATGLLTPVDAAVLVYSGQCQVSYVASVASTSEELAGRELAPDRFEVKVPLTAPLAQRGDIVTVDTATNDPALAGRQFRVLAASGGTLVVRRSLLCEDAW